jgi:hypothetical protein
MAQRWLSGEEAWGAVFAGLALLGCGGSDSADRSTSGQLAGDALSVGGEEAGASSVSPSDVSDEVAAPSVPGPGTPPPPQEGAGVVAPGTLTAGAWDDSRNLDRFLDYRHELEGKTLEGLPWFDEQAQRAAAARAAQLEPHATLDVALVIDTTGSMLDELRYLQSEFDALSASIEAAYPNAEQRWALVVYRDEGDEYLTRSFDFQAASTFRGQLSAQGAGGGGDIPEASDAALEAMNQLGWRSGATTAKLAFWVGDAPHHLEAAEGLAAAVGVAASQGIHVYPVASSGVDELAEYAMRAAAQLTLGRYLFLTDDSGVGGTHKEPSIPCYFVTKLDDAILRMVDIEMSGVYRVPSTEQVIRAGGDPTGGACQLESGQTALAF